MIEWHQFDPLEFDKKDDSMKKDVSVLLVCLLLSALCVGCGNQKAEPTQTTTTTAIGNPWSDWDSLEDAESAVGFSFGLPDVIADRYHAVSFRTLNGELIQVVYSDEDSEICVRKQAGNVQDISGDYNEYETCTEEDHTGGTITTYRNSDNNAVKQIISYNGYSWSLVAPNGFWGDSNQDFVNMIWED